MAGESFRLVSYTAYLRDNPGGVARVDSALRLLLPAAVVSELLRQNLDQLERFLGKPVVDFVPVTLETCHHFGSVATALRRAGTPIPVNDVWVAAHALQTGASLLTHDAHFKRIPELPVIHPA